MQLESYHVYGAVFIAYMVIKEVFVLVKGETKEILKKVTSILDRLDDVKKLREDVAEIRSWHREREMMFDKLDETSDRIDDLWEWHNKEDGDGVRIWYVRSSLQKTLDKLGETLNKEHALVSEMANNYSLLKVEVDRLKDELDKRN